MEDSAATTLTERYAAIEQAYTAHRWSTVLQLGQALMRDLQIEATPTALALRQRLQLMLGHTQLYGFRDGEAAADCYRSLLNQRSDPSLRQMAEQGLQQCRLLGSMAAAGGQATQAESRAEPGRPPSQTAGAAAALSPRAAAGASAAATSPVAETPRTEASPPPAASGRAAPVPSQGEASPSASPSASPGSAAAGRPGAPASPSTVAAAGVGSAAAAATPWLADLGGQRKDPAAGPFLVQDPFLKAGAAVTPAAPQPEQAPGGGSQRQTITPLQGEGSDQVNPAQAPGASVPPAAAASTAVAGAPGLAAAAAAAVAASASSGDASSAPSATAPVASSAPPPQRAEPVAQGPAPSKAAPEASAPGPLIPEVVDEPELIEVHQADPRLAEEFELRLDMAESVGGEEPRLSLRKRELLDSSLSSEPQAQPQEEDDDDPELRRCLLLVRLPLR
ncbi:MAG: hypothetical protein VKK62_04550 [Synechococcaceae cyanobacterium]|nr:hypothetical protein [Synechococcaceae cyanobacterium]